MTYDCLCELVSFRLYHITKTALHTLQHENILTVEEIMDCFLMATMLVSAAGVICEGFASSHITSVSPSTQCLWPDFPCTRVLAGDGCAVGPGGKLREGRCDAAVGEFGFQGSGCEPAKKTREKYMT